METPTFNSRDPLCKAPFGAVPCATNITLTLRPSLAEGFVSAALLLHLEFAGERRELPMVPAGIAGDCALFTITYAAPSQPDLLWYTFRLTRQDGSTLLLDRDGLPWQQTVYDDSLPTPDWFGRGVTYQIFPDRFRRAGLLPDPDGLVGRRELRRDWEYPLTLPEDQGDNPSCDFYGGTLAGIEEGLDYLERLGVSTLYLCPIFESASNHRYNTADYERIDPMLGTEEDFRRLCAHAKARNIRVMLDGVFNHTGSDSRYFNAQGCYPAPGAAQSQDSPYFPWYTFRRWPEEYEAWWGISTLPAVNEMHPTYLDYIVRDRDSIVRRWLRSGADAWRLDVADELPDVFIAEIRRAMMEEKPDSFLLGEVWEDGSTKIAYDQRRRYLLGRETHGLMNYPFRLAALAYLLGRDEEGAPYAAQDFREAMETIRENYPAPAFYSAMNMLDTHDTPRALTLLGCGNDRPEDRRARAAFSMSPEQRALGLRRLRLGALLLYAFPGSPTVFYGDEAGMEGWEDPMNRGTFPWGREDRELQWYYALLGRLRRGLAPLQSGSLHWLWAQGPLLAFARDQRGETVIAALNAGEADARLTLDWPAGRAMDALTGRELAVQSGKVEISLPGISGVLVTARK